MAKLNHPGNLKYSKSDEWVSVEGDQATIGITDYAQDQLGDIVYVELPKVGQNVEQDTKFGDIESVKATSELISPVSGEVIKVNDTLDQEPEQINDDPYQKGWMLVVRLSDPKQVESLLSADAYEQHLEGH